MRKINTGVGEIIVRSLTRQEIRGGSETFNMSYLSTGLESDLRNFDDYRDYVLSRQFDDEEIDQFSNAEQNAILDAIIRDTWGDAREEKNLSGSGESDQTPTENKSV